MRGRSLRNPSSWAAWLGSRAARHGRVPRGCRLAPVLAMLVAFGGPARAEDYQIEAGDVLEFSVASLPGLKQRTSVDISGDVNFPLLQDIRAAGLHITELRTKVRELISAKPFRQRGSDGRETLLTIDPDEISISIVEYRPIYVTGDVVRPGEQPFRPGVTVRQAVVLGGGYGSGKQQQNGNVPLQLADLRGEYQSLWADLLGRQATIARDQAELDGRASFDEALAQSSPIDPATQKAIVQRERDRFASRVRDFDNEKVFLARSVDEADHFLSSLNEQQANEKQGADLDSQDFDRINALFAKGAVPITRVMDARRAVLLSSTRQLQTSVAASETQIRKEGFVRSLDRLADQRRAELLAELQTTSLAALQLQARLRSTSRKMTILGASGDGAGDRPDARVTVFRKGRTPIAGADDEMGLQPGDVVEVALEDDATTSPAMR